MNLASTLRFLVVGTLITVCLAAVAALGMAISGFDPSEFSLAGGNSEQDTERQIKEFCGACHVVPHPTALPRTSWPEEIEKAFERYRVSGRTDLTVPSQSRITKYFAQRSPAVLSIPNAPDSEVSRVPFRVEISPLPGTIKTAAVSYLTTVNSGSTHGFAAKDLLLCDMGNGSINRFSWMTGQIVRSELSKLNHPAHVVPCDFDQDGNQDFLVADLGMLKPTDELLGSVTLLRSTDSGSSYEAVTILENVARVADAQVADLDGDGDLDFVVAEFGYEKVGRLIWLETLEIVRGRPKTKLRVIDSRHGSIHSPVTDLDGDGDFDLIVIFGQEYEAIVAFLNNGQGKFEAKTIFQADIPSSGNTGLELADLDGDHDLDVLFTNGDTLDTMQLKPYHGVNWLENVGECEFQYHRLTDLPGAVRAVTGDFDNDGDVDIAAVAFCPPFLKYQTRPPVFDTVIWLEQIRPGEYLRHSLDRSQAGPLPVAAGSMSIAAGDFDGDQDIDLVVGEFNPYAENALRNTRTSEQKWFTLFWNDSIQTGEAVDTALEQ